MLKSPSALKCLCSFLPLLVVPKKGTDAAVGAVAARVGSSRKSDRHLNGRPAVLHGSSQPPPLAGRPPPVAVPSPGCGLLSSSVPVMYPLLLTVKRYGSAPCQPPLPLMLSHMPNYLP